MHKAENKNKNRRNNKVSVMSPSATPTCRKQKPEVWAPFGSDGWRVNIARIAMGGERVLRVS